MIPLLDRPPCPTHPSHLCLNWEWNRQVFSAGEGTQQWITALPPPLVFIHHLPLYPYPLSLIICPILDPMVPLELSLQVHPWNNNLIVIIVCAS